MKRPHSSHLGLLGFRSDEEGSGGVSCVLQRQKKWLERVKLEIPVWDGTDSAIGERKRETKKRSERVARLPWRRPHPMNEEHVRVCGQKLTKWGETHQSTPPRSHFSLFVVCPWCWNRLNLGLQSLNLSTIVSPFSHGWNCRLWRRTNDISCIDGRVSEFTFWVTEFFLCSMWSGWLGTLAIANPSWSKLKSAHSHLLKSI